MRKKHMEKYVVTLTIITDPQYLDKRDIEYMGNYLASQFQSFFDEDQTHDLVVDIKGYKAVEKKSE